MGGQYSRLPLTITQEKILELGLNFALVSTRLPLLDTIPAVEEATRQMDNEDVEDLQGRVCGILEHPKIPKTI